MDNTMFIKEYIAGKHEFGAHAHLGYSGDTLFNYATEICKVNRANKTARLNVKKYSVTTSSIQSSLKHLLGVEGYTIEEYIGPSAEKWEVGAKNLTRAEMRNK